MARVPVKRSRDYMVWVDCEMTGLDPSRHVILEIATIITDFDLSVIALGPELTIRQSAAKMRAMDPWPRRTHAASGLLDRVAKEGVTLAEAEAQTLRFIRKHCYAQTAPLCGNSIWQDKQFLSRYMPDVVDFLHYRIIDVSTVKQLVTRWSPLRVQPPAKTETHRALADIQESIAELQAYKTLFR
ncbi:MAG TPA: oligoribonuclease [Vicinamibacterales bacterium]